MPRSTAKSRKKTTTVVEEVPEEAVLLNPEEPTELDFNLEEVQDTERLREVIEQFPGSGIAVRIYDERGYYCFAIPDPTNIDEELIRKRCGAGQFVGRIYVRGKYKHSIQIPIRAVDPDPNDKTVAPSTNSGENSHTAFLEKLVLNLTAANNNHGNSGTPTLTEMTQALSNMDSLRGKQESAMDIFLKGAEFAKTILGSGGGEGTDWKTEAIRTVREGLPMLGAVMEQRGGVPPNPANPQPGQPPGGTKELISTDLKLKMGIAYLKKKAIAGMDPGLFVDWVVGNAEEPDYQLLIHAVFTNDFEKFVAIDPEIGTGPFVQWFRAIYDGLRSSFSSPDSVADDTGRDAGDVNNPGNNGKPSTGKQK